MGRKGFIWLIIQDYCSSLKEVRIGTEAPTSIHREMHSNMEMWRLERAGVKGTKLFGQLFGKNWGIYKIILSKIKKYFYFFPQDYTVALKDNMFSQGSQCVASLKDLKCHAQ